MPPKKRDYDLEERAAILEYDANIPRLKAEALAQEMEEARTKAGRQLSLMPEGDPEWGPRSW